MTVAVCKESATWNSYVESAPEASNCHRWVWKQVIEETFGHEAYYLAASEGAVLRGVLPLVFLHSRLFGRFLVSMPFLTYGGVLASEPKARKELLSAAVGLAVTLRARHIELRQGAASECDEVWRNVTPKVTMEVVLPKSVEALWDRLTSGLRNKIRCARKRGLSAHWGGNEAVSDFYSLFAANMRNLGTPVYPREWFENMSRSLPSGVRILTVCDDGKPVAGAFLMPFRDTLELPWSASLPDSRRKYSHVFLYWTFLEWAVQNGYRRVDLGRCTPGSGTHEFKRHWACEEKPLHWYYWLAPGTRVPDLRPDTPRFRLATRVWQRLPLGVANLVGPRIVRSIP